MTTYTPSDKKPNFWQSLKQKVAARPEKAYVNPYLAGILLGVVLFGAFFITGSGLGASGGLNRMLVYIQDLFAPDHVNRTPYLIAMAGGSKNPLDSWIVFLTLGAILGGFVSGLRNGRVKVETNRGPQVPKRVRWVTAFIGGALMGLWRPFRPRLYLGPGSLRRRGAVGRQLGVHVRCFRRSLCAGLFHAQVLELRRLKWRHFRYH